MIAFKAFDPGLVCRGYQFKFGLNTTKKANCRENGFHCAEDPLDCLSYYGLARTEFYLVDAGGDVHEDGEDSKISCTRLTILRRLDLQQFFFHAIVYMAEHPHRRWSVQVNKDKAAAASGYAVVRGLDPLACGKVGDYLVLVREKPSDVICETALVEVDGKKIKADTWYGVDLSPRQVIHA